MVTSPEDTSMGKGISSIEQHIPAPTNSAQISEAVLDQKNDLLQK